MAKKAFWDYLLVAVVLLFGVGLLLLGLLGNFSVEAGRIVSETDSGEVTKWLSVGFGGALLLLALLLFLMVNRRRKQVDDPDHEEKHHLVEGLFSKPEQLKPGLYHLRSGDAFDGYRVHLRVEPKGNGTLVVNAAKIIHLNNTATEYAKLIVEEQSKKSAVDEITARYRVKRKTAEADYDRIRGIITELAMGSDICPVTYLDLDRREPFSVETTAPYRVDLVLTYDCNADCSHCYVDEAHRSQTPISVEEWKRTMDKLWEAGVPHVTFTGGEATIYPHLRELIEYAEDIGLVTGLLTNGIRLADKDFLSGLVEAGLDHVQITIESHDAAVHDEMVRHPGAWQKTVQGIRNALELPLYVLTNTTLTKRNAKGAEQTVEFLADLGLHQIAANGMIHAGRGKANPDAFTEAELIPVVESFFNSATRLGLNFLWYTPTCYNELNPIELGIGIKTCSAARYNLAVEPNGDVLPCQSYYEALGNITTDDWESIWNAPLANEIRNRDWLPDKCDGCPELPLCGGGCPLIYKEGADISCSAPG